MDQSERTLQILELLFKNEQNLSLLYELYSNHYPEYRDFWLHLSNDEVEHASWLQGLYEESRTGALQFEEGRFHPEAITLMINNVESQIEQIKLEPISLEQALAHTMSDESTILEQRFFQVFESDTETLKSVLNNLAAATQRHYQEVKLMWEKVSAHQTIPA